MTEWSVENTGLDTLRESLIVDHIPLLKHIVGRMCLDIPGAMERDDLFGFGMIGLIAAADSWDEKRGVKFSTYAYPKIRGAILDEMRRMDFLPRSRREQVRSLDQVVRRLEQESGKAPTPEEIARVMGIVVEEVDEILLSARSSMETSLDDGTSGELASLLCDPKSDDPIGSASWNEMKKLLVESIQALPEQEKTVITLYYAESLFLRDIAQVLGVTESRVSQIHSRALYRLNRHLRVLIGSEG